MVAPRALLPVMVGMLRLCSWVVGGGQGMSCDFLRLMELLREAEAGEPTATARTRRRAMWAACVALDEAEPLKVEISARCSSEDAENVANIHAPTAEEPLEGVPSRWHSWLGLTTPPPPPPPAPSPPPVPRPPAPPPPPPLPPPPSARLSITSSADTEVDRGPELLCDFTALLTCSEAELKEDGGDPFCLSHKHRCYNVARSFESPW